MYGAKSSQLAHSTNTRRRILSEEPWLGHYGRVRKALDVVHALGTTTHLKDLMSCQKPLDSVDQRTGGPFLLLYVTGEWLT